MDAYRAVVDKRDQRAFLPRPIPEETLLAAGALLVASAAALGPRQRGTDIEPA